MKKFIRTISIILVIAMILPFAPDAKLIFNEISVFATKNGESEEESTSDTENSQENIEMEENKGEVQTITDRFAFPDEMKAVRIVPGKDYFSDSEQSLDTTKSEIDTIMNNLNTYGMNSIIIDTNYEDMSLYCLEPGLTNEENALKMLIDKAKDNLFYVYLNININHVMNEFEDSTLEYKINYVTQIAHKFSSNYFIDGIILDGYYSKKDINNYKYYAKDGSGIGFENWLLDNGAYVFSLVSESIHKTDSTVPVGINISDAWANKSENENGSDTNDSFQALTDGYADTVNYIENGYADFIMLTADGAIDDEDMPFETVTSWWSEKAVDANIPMFICHTNEKLCTNATGWLSDDQIVKQLISTRELLQYQGSAFNSYSSLVNNYTGDPKNNPGTTDVLIKHYNGQINEDALSNELEMNVPQKTNFTTNEPVQIFQGSFDENFSVTLNGEPVEINEAGYFYIERELKVGWNEFTFQSKAKKQTYKIYRDIVIFDSIEPEQNMNVEGGTTITVTAIAYKGTTVTATFNGETKPLEESEGEFSGQNLKSSYTKYATTFQAPEGIVLKEQDLGNIVITGNYKGIKSTTKTGGRIKVNPLPEEAVPKDIIEIKNDNTMTYDYYTTQTYTVPTCPRLPAGTKDYVVKSVRYGGIDFYLTESGMRIKAEDARVISGNSFVNNKLSIVDTYMDNGDTVIKIKLDQKIPFNVVYNNTNYFNFGEGGYNLSSFKSSKVTIEFSLVSSVSGLPEFPAGSIFSSASWSTSGSGTKTKHQLNLNLAQTGIYSGITSTYSSDGCLLLKFNDYNTSISGSTIVIDPGHGLTSNGFDVGAPGYVTEQSINIKVARKLTEKLRSMGANAIMLETETKLIDRKYRPEIARQYNADMFISIHCNATTHGNGVRGTETYYFNSFSQPLAKCIVDSLGYAWKNQIYGDGVNRIRGRDGTYWNWFDVTLMQDFPSVLVELGFVTDKTEAMALYNSSNQDILVNALVDGIEDYFDRK